MTRVALIESVVRTTWTKMKASAIAASKEDVKLSTQLLLKVLGADEVSGELRPSAKAELDRVNAIVARSEIVFLEVFGSRGGAVLQEILSRHDPRENSDVFTAACVSQLEPLLGAQHAQSILQP